MLEFIEQQSFTFEPDIKDATVEETTQGSEFVALSKTDAEPEAATSGLAEDVLLAMSREGNLEAFSELIRRHYNMCLKRALLLIRNRGDAEDEVQNTFWKAFHRLEQFRGEGTFAAWLSRIVENQCLMRIREARQTHFVYLDESNESNVRLELVGQTLNPEDQVGDRQVVDLLRKEISRIPPLLRNVMLLRDVQQLPMNVVAERLGLSVPAAKSRLMRARAELRSRLSKHCGPRGPATLMQKARYNKSAYASAA
jgi:RNA polymerase sigma-70 factor (ECF subfamily)